MLTLAATVSHTQEVRKSRFLAHATHVADETEAMAFFARVADAGATHNCWAWRQGSRYRSHDDGEPGGTAGRPILAAIDGQGLDQVAVLVTRWFGGIKLGAGGLVRAYGGTAAQCLQLAPQRAVIALRALQLHCGFEHTGAIHALLSQHQAQKISENYRADGIDIELWVPESRCAPLCDAVRDATRGQARVLTVMANRRPE